MTSDSNEITRESARETTRHKSSVVQTLADRKLAVPPRWLPGAVAYETIMGSVAYGVSSDTSDMDVYGFCVPPKETVFPHFAGEISGFGKQIQRFEQFQQHHIADPDALGGSGRVYDLTIFSIVKFFQLAMENNPNVLDSLFTPASCVLHSTRIGEMVRDRRRDFLHRGAWHKFKGYAYSQIHKMDIKTPQAGSKRAADVEKFGFDCYDDEETEFLTRRGWLRFDDVTGEDELAGVDPVTGRIEWSRYQARADKKYTGDLYTIEPYLSRCVVTEGHRMLVSPLHRNPGNNYSTAYVPECANWRLETLGVLLNGKKGSRTQRSFFHIRRNGFSDAADYPVTDEYLVLAGLYLSDGAMRFCGEKARCIALTQTEGGKAEFFDVATRLQQTYPMRRYNYAKETVWLLHGAVARQAFSDFGRGSRGKRLPDWCYRLSVRQAELLWYALCLGDGTKAVNGDVYYTVSKHLASDIQAMLTASGLLCSVRGPYESDTAYASTDIYQIFRSSSALPVHYVNFGRVQDENTPPSVGRRGWPVKSRFVEERRVVCFTVPCGVLITRSDGKVAVQGNCKFAYHVVRLLDEVEQILTTGNMDLQRDRERLKAIRRGEWTAEQVREFFTTKERDLESAYAQSALPHGPDEAKIKTLLLECLEAHYGSLGAAIALPDQERELLRQIKALCEKAGV